MKTKKILDQIQHKLQDDSYEREEILDVVQEGLLYIAGHFPLPALQASDTVETVADSDNTILPQDFQHNMFRVWNKTKKTECQIPYSRRTLEELYAGLTEEGSVEAVVDEGGRLYYRRIPASVETLEISYNALPPTLVDDTEDEPTCLPPHLQGKLLVSYALSELYSEIEDGLEGQKVDTSFYWQKFSSAYNDLERTFPGVARQKRYIPRRIKYF